MKTKKETGIIEPIKDETVCKLYQNLSAFMEELNRLQDAAEAEEEILRSAEAAALPLIF